MNNPGHAQFAVPRGQALSLPDVSVDPLGIRLEARPETFPSRIKKRLVFLFRVSPPATVAIAGQGISAQELRGLSGQNECRYYVGPIQECVSI